ncbi:Aste57867_7562 [Aphanomyces stellatus]|uniref:Aste57867_7562 protein n=1 Tax=Aphanomyces stellatus TaxID=120398 RepID=A0A485KII7_9STRA|nr:hypothetical protein As57867_007536 [Aphanomyces stellatus]VFT84471.1 Aste57867_7562 [Aphanomyces stellatus]
MTDTTAVYVGQYYVTQIAIEAMYDKGCLTPQGLRRFAEEICLMSTFSHPNVVALVGFAYQKNHPVPLLAATEFLPGGNLASFLRNTPDLPWCTKARLALDIVNALVYLHHTLAVIHRDVKTQHVLLNWPRAILAGFGVAMWTDVCAVLPSLPGVSQATHSQPTKSPEQCTQSPRMCHFRGHTQSIQTCIVE